MKQDNDVEFSFWVYLIFVLWIFGNLANMFKDIMILAQTGEMTLFIISLLFHVMMMIILCLLLFAKKIAMYLFFIMQVFPVVVNSIIYGDLFLYFFVAVIRCVIMYLILQIKHNGVSAWKVIMSKK